MISQALIFLLCADAAYVAYGLSRNQNMWRWIVVCWIMLTIKNLADFVRDVGSKKGK